MASWGGQAGNEGTHLCFQGQDLMVMTSRVPRTTYQDYLKREEEEGERGRKEGKNEREGRKRGEKVEKGKGRIQIGKAVAYTTALPPPRGIGGGGRSGIRLTKEDSCHWKHRTLMREIEQGRGKKWKDHPHS